MALVEGAMVMTVFLTLVLGAIDLGTAVFRQHILSEAARQGARAAIVHGSLAPSSWNGGPWGTTTYGPVAANTSSSQAQAVAAYLGGMNPADVQVTISWPDGSNAAESRVTVTLTTPWTPLMGFIFGSPSITLTGASTMQIAH
jgi:Flp pilus assembly protein TadG